MRSTTPAEAARDVPRRIGKAAKAQAAIRIPARRLFNKRGSDALIFDSRKI
jgi:hypothetical protein